MLMIRKSSVAGGSAPGAFGLYSLLLALGLGAFAGCGQKGALFLPSAAPAASASASASAASSASGPSR